VRAPWKGACRPHGR